MAEPGGACDVDFGRTFLRFSTTRVNHTPRLSVDAVCRLIGPDGAERRYYLTCACVGERMYVARDMILEPVCEFNLVAAPREQFLMMKRHASAEHDVRSAHRFGELMPTHDGKGARVVGLDVTVACYAAVRPIRGYREFREALLADRPINGRTSYLDEDGQTIVALEYPVRTGNVAHDREAWQVDAGPVAMPAAGAGGGLEAARFALAFLVYNSWDYAEAVLSAATAVGGGDRPGRTEHYSVRRSLDCRNELFEAV